MGKAWLISDSCARIAPADKSRLHHHQRRILHELTELREVGGADGAVDDTVIAAEADPHALASNDGALVAHDGDVANAANAEDSGLRRIDDGGELVHAIGAEIADGNRAARELVGAEFLVLRAGGEVFHGGA